MRTRKGHLDGLLRIRQRLKEASERELRSRLSVHNKMRDELAKIDEEITECSKSLPVNCQGAEDTQVLIEKRKDLDQLCRYGREKRQSFSELVTEVEIARKKLMAAREEFMVIEKLVERARDARLKRTERREVLELDELAQARHISNREA